MFNFVLAVRVGQRLSPADVERGLDGVRGRHVAFSSPPGSATAPPDAPRFPLRVLDGSGAPGWQAVAEEELARPFGPEEAPRARFTMLPSDERTDLVLTCDHMVSDGMSGGYLLRDLLAVLAAPGTVLPPLPRPPGIPEVLPAGFRESPASRLRVAAVRAGIRWSSWYEAHRRGAAPEPGGGAGAGAGAGADGRTGAGGGGNADATSRGFRIVSRGLSGEHTAALVGRCRREGTTVHGAVCAALLLALVEGSTGRQRRAVSSPVNLRHLLTGPDAEAAEAAGLLITPVVTSVRLAADSDPWDLAREIRHRLSRDTTGERLLRRVLRMSTIFGEAHRAAAAGEPGDGPPPLRPADYDLSVTNLGRFPLQPPGAPFLVEAMYGPMVNVVPGERTIGVCTCAGRLQLVYTAFDEPGEPERGAALLTSAARTLLDALDRP